MENKEKLCLNIFSRICSHQHIRHILPTMEELFGKRIRKWLVSTFSPSFAHINIVPTFFSQRTCALTRCGPEERILILKWGERRFWSGEKEDRLLRSGEFWGKYCVRGQREAAMQDYERKWSLKGSRGNARLVGTVFVPFPCILDI